MWKEILGIDSEFVDEEYRVFLESRKDASRWELARLGWTADYNDAGDFLDILRSGSPNNDPRYKRQEYDNLLDRAAIDGQAIRSATNFCKRQRKWFCPTIQYYQFTFLAQRGS